MKNIKLKGRIIQIYGSQSEFADKIGLSQVSVSHKLNGKTKFFPKDIKKWCEALNIPQAEEKFFFPVELKDF